MFRRHRQKGSQVNHTARSAKAPSLRTGVFANGAASLGSKGSGAPSLGLIGLLGLALVALLAFAASPASALAAPPAEFGSEGSGAGQINEPRGIAVDQETHDVYLADNEVLFSGAAA